MIFLTPNTKRQATNKSSPRLPSHNLNDQVSYDHFGTSLKTLLTTSKDLPQEPATVKVALNGLHANEWKRAMDAEMATLTERGTWELVELLKGYCPTCLKLFFIVNTHANSNIELIKTRVVAKGFTKVHMEDVYEMHAPVSDYTIRNAPPCHRHHEKTPSYAT